MSAPGSWARPDDVWCAVRALTGRVPQGALWVVDAKVARLHPQVVRAASAARAFGVLQVTAGERLKSLRTVERLALGAQRLSRGGAVVAVGGGTVGDTVTVLAHLLKRGVDLVQVPSTLLAAVDSSLGGKGAVNLGEVKNALGVFHSPARSFLCPELFTTLSPAQCREGAVEAFKMAVCLDASAWARVSGARAVSQEALVRLSRALKAQVCDQDPYERTGRRAVLNFGHTFGHVVESVTRFRVRHGEAVGLGVHAALDVGRQLGVTPERTASQVEAGFASVAPRARARLAQALADVSPARLQALLEADKKSSARGLRMVMLERPGRTVLRDVDGAVWRSCLTAWKTGARP